MHLGLIYPCILGARMLGSTLFPWVISGSSLRTEDCLFYAFIVAGLAVFIMSYDYQVFKLPFVSNCNCRYENVSYLNVFLPVICRKSEF